MIHTKAHKERRKQKRFAVTGKPDSSLKKSTGEELPFVLVDVSRDGLGIVTDGIIEVHETLLLTIKRNPQLEIPLVVKWLKPSSDLESDPTSFAPMSRIGLQTSRADINLESEFRKMKDVSMEDLS
jgi:hypothetical protein